MAVVIFVQSRVDGVQINAYLADYDASALPQPRMISSPHVEDAMRFESHEAAIEAYRAVREPEPLRPDGLPNRPLTAYHVEIIDEHATPFGWQNAGY